MADRASLVLALAIVAGFVGGLRPGIVGLPPTRGRSATASSSSRGLTWRGRNISYGAAINVVVIVAIGLVLYRLRNRVQITLWHAWVPFLLGDPDCGVLFPGRGRWISKISDRLSRIWRMFALPFVLVKTERDALFFFKVIILSSHWRPWLMGFFSSASGWGLGIRTRASRAHSVIPTDLRLFYLLTTIATVLSLLLSQRFRLMAATRKLLGAYLVPLLILLVATKTQRLAGMCNYIHRLRADHKRVLVMTLALPLLALFVPAVRERLADLSTGNEICRDGFRMLMPMWSKTALGRGGRLHIAQRPLFGYGLYSFPYYSPSFLPWKTERGVDAHNVYVQLLVRDRHNGPSEPSGFLFASSRRCFAISSSTGRPWQ